MMMTDENERRGEYAMQMMQFFFQFKNGQKRENRKISLKKFKKKCMVL
jgi:hypothetical protein